MFCFLRNDRKIVENLYIILFFIRKYNESIHLRFSRNMESFRLSPSEESAATCKMTEYYF